jgi:hypothetical protein
MENTNTLMMTKINKKTYSELIKQDIDYLSKLSPKNNMEKDHIIQVLKESIKNKYEKI